MKPRPIRTQMVAFGQQVGRWRKSPPKNSIALIDRAIQKGFDIIELDVRIANDGIAVLGHDDLIKGQSGEISISATSSKELSSFSIGEYNGETQYIATLSDALIQVKNKKVLMEVLYFFCW